MTVDDVTAIVEEADRLAAETIGIPEYVPSEIFQHQVLADVRGHVDCEHDCQRKQLWNLITTSRVFAVMIRDERARDALDDAVDVFDVDIYTGAVLHVHTGLLDESDEAFREFSNAISAWMTMRIQQLMQSLPESATGEQMSKYLMCEGFIAGAMFAQAMEKIRGSH